MIKILTDFARVFVRQVTFAAACVSHHGFSNTLSLMCVHYVNG